MNPFKSLVLKVAGRLRFPYLFLVTAGLFLLDLFTPDLIPFADEILLGLFTLLLGSWRKKRERIGPSGERPNNAFARMRDEP